jgi:hypothetical protein
MSPSYANLIFSPFESFTNSLFASGTVSPRMTIKRRPFSPEQLSSKLYALLNSESHISSLPDDILLIIFSFVSKNRKKINAQKDLLSCSRVSKRLPFPNIRFNVYANAFLWRHINISKSNAFDSLISTLRIDGNISRLACHTKIITLSYVTSISQEKLLFLLENTHLLTSITFEKCYIESVPPNIKLPFPLKNLKHLTVSESATCPSNPILWICQQCTLLESLELTGCNFNENDMCEFISVCPNLKSIKLGSHFGASMTAIGAAGGNEFARALSLNCKYLTRADLTGIISMTDQGWNIFIQAFCGQLQKLCVRRAMQISLSQLCKISLCASLQYLTIANIPHFDDSTLVHCIEHIGKQLNFLQLESIPVTDLAIQSITRICINLRQFRILQCTGLENLDYLVQNNLNLLRALVLHYCPNISTQRQYNNLETGDTALTTPARVIDTSFMPIQHAFLESSTMSQPPTPTKEGFINLYHLEIIDCENIDQYSIDFLVRKSSLLKRFVYAGNNFSKNTQEYLTLNPIIFSSIYSFTPGAPNFE